MKLNDQLVINGRRQLHTLQMIKRDSYLKALIYGFLLIAIYFSALKALVINGWSRDGYSFAYLVPFIVLYLIWIKKDDLSALPPLPSWKGMIPLGLGIILFWLGELGGEFFTLYISLWLTLVGLFWMHNGWQKLKTISFGFFFMLTMFPVPEFIAVKLTLKLRFISSVLGVAIIKVFGIPVFRKGNIIDLGFTQLQVVEACSGLHSLISLTVLCLLLVYFFKDHIWKRVILLISSIPLAIVTNSMRIAITAILYKYFGAKAAEGFFHGFAGLLIFAICIPVLLIEMKILEKLPPVQSKTTSELKRTGVTGFGNNPGNLMTKGSNQTVLFQPTFLVAVMLLGATLTISQTVDFRERIPTKKSLEQFPLKIDNWVAIHRERMAQKFLNELDLSEYVIINYQNQIGKKVNFYVAYYESQRKGESIHSPATCLPGSGWSFNQSGKVKIADVNGNKGIMEVNRAVMQLGRNRQITYYWFPVRGRILNNAYQLKLYNFWDALTKQRTDGALVRLITSVYNDETLEEAEKRLQNFVRDVSPVLEEYIPGKDI